MSTMTFVGRIGRDSELRYTPGGEPVINLAVAYNYGRKGQDGKKPTQWVDAALFGKRAESMAQYLTKGTQLFLVLSDVNVRTFNKQDGTQGFALSGNVQTIEFVGSAPQQQQQAPTPQTKPQPRQQAPKAPEPVAGGIDPFSDDIPFAQVDWRL